MIDGFSTSRSFRSSAANSTRPGTTGKEWQRPRWRLWISDSRDIPQGLFAKRLHDRRAENFRVDLALGLLRQLHGEAGDVDAVAGGVAFVRGVGLLQKIGDVIQDVVVPKW